MKNKKVIMILFSLALLMSVFGTSRVNAALNNTETFTTHYYSDGSRTFEIGNYKGTCCQAGVDATGGQQTATGTANMNRWNNTTYAAKIAYYVSYVGKCTSNIAGSSANNNYWYNNRSCRPTKFDDLGLVDKFQISLLAENLVQLGVQGESTWRTAAADKLSYPSSYINYVVSTRNAIIDKYDNGQLSVPSNFEIYIGNPTDGKQDFAVWTLIPYSGTKTYATDTTSGANGAAVKAGDEIKYQIKWQGGSGTMTITDTLSKGLSYVAGSSSLGDPTITNNSNGTTTLKWTTTQESGTLTYKAKVALDICKLGIDQVQNNAAMSVDGTNHTLGELHNPVPSKCYASDSQDGKDGASVAVGDKIKYAIKYANTKTSSTTATITDTLSKGLSYVSGSAKIGTTVVNPTIANNSDGTTTLTWTRTLAAGASEEIKYEVQVKSTAAGNKVCNNATVTIGNKITLTPICNPVPSKTYGGSSLSNNPGWNHHEVKVGDDIKYSIKLPNVKNTAQTVVVRDVLSKGLTYNGDIRVTDGTITSTVTPVVNSDTKTTTLAWVISVPAGKTAVLNYSAKVNKDAVNIVNNNANCQYGTDPSIELAELHNPVPTKEYDVDTADGMNGQMVQKEDKITYNISYANPYKEKATINLRDTLSKGLTYKKGTAKVCDYKKTNCKSLTELGITEKVTVKNDGKTEILWTRTGMPSLGVEIIVYEVEVTGETVQVGNDFDIKTCKETESTSQTIQIPDCKEQLNNNCAPLCDPATDNNCKPATDSECQSTKQECSVTGLVCSSPWMDIEELKNPVPVKEYDEKTPSGYGETAVAEGNRIRYKIRYANVAEEKVTITIKDTLSQGITYIKGTSKVGNETIADPEIKGQQLTWTRELEKGAEEALTYEVKVTGDKDIVNNNACMIYDNNPEYESCLTQLYNPVPQKTYAEDTKAGNNGAIVKKDDVISYSIKYANVKKEKQTIIITDTLSKGLEYQKGSAKINGKAVAPNSVSKNDNGTTTIIWMTELAAGKKAELVYGARVTGETKKVQNNANIQYGTDPVIHLNELKNPLIENEVVIIPDTGSQISLIAVVAGVTLITGGGYVLYRKYKKA